MLPTVLLILVTASTLLIASTVLITNRKALVNRTLAYIALSLILWQVANYLADRPGMYTIWWNRATFIGPLFVFLFSNQFINAIAGRIRFSKQDKVFFVVTAVLALYCIIGNVISGVNPRILADSVQGYNVTRGSGYLIVIGWLLFLLVRFLRNLVVLFSTSEGKIRQQLKIVAYGVATAVAAGLTTNLLLPIVSGDTASAQYAPIAGIAFMASLAIAIVKHGLFNVKLLVVRALGYTLSIGVISVSYGFIMFGTARLLFDLQISVLGQVALSVATGIAALLFNRLKRFFDTLSKSLFYQDAYDPEALFDEYNKTLVSTIELDLLLKRITHVIAEHLKPTHCLIGVKDENVDGYHIVGTQKEQFSSSDIAYVRAMTPHIHRMVIVVDDLSSDFLPLQSVMQKYDIALLVRLTTNERVTQEGVGYLVLGPKKSGNPYTNQDIKVIETLANELIIALQNALRFEEIERFNETLQQRVNDATRQLRESNKKLKQLNESKDDFIGMASHQLRTPLTSIKGYVSLVMDGDAGKVTETQRKLLQQAFSSAQKMVYLVADLLNVSRLKTGKFVIERKPTNLSTLIHEEMGQLNEEAKSRGLELTFDTPSNFPTLPLDETKTRQVIMNFLDNAIYYTPSGGHIKVELKELPKSIEFRVVDDGIGVPKAERHHLFTKFYRAKNAQRARPDGTGLGLYMAQKVVMAHGGATIFSSQEGKGSTFGFMFPKDMPTGQVSLPIQTRD